MTISKLLKILIIYDDFTCMNIYTCITNQLVRTLNTADLSGLNLNDQGTSLGECNLGESYTLFYSSFTLFSEEHCFDKIVWIFSCRSARFQRKDVGQVLTVILKNYITNRRIRTLVTRNPSVLI